MTTTASSEETQWGVRHEGGKVTGRNDGRLFVSRISAEREAVKLDCGCEHCSGDCHEVVYRTITYTGWETPGPLPLRLPQRGQ